MIYSSSNVTADHLFISGCTLFNYYFFGTGISTRLFCQNIFFYNCGNSRFNGEVGTSNIVDLSSSSTEGSAGHHRPNFAFDLIAKVWSDDYTFHENDYSLLPSYCYSSHFTPSSFFSSTFQFPETKVFSSTFEFSYSNIITLTVSAYPSLFTPSLTFSIAYFTTTIVYPEHFYKTREPLSESAIRNTKIVGFFVFFVLLGGFIIALIRRHFRYKRHAAGIHSSDSIIIFDHELSDW